MSMKCADCRITITEKMEHRTIASFTESANVQVEYICVRCGTYRDDPECHPGRCPMCGNDHATDNPRDYDTGYECYQLAGLMGGDIRRQYRAYQHAMRRYCDRMMRERMEGPLPTKCPQCDKEHRADDFAGITVCSEAIKLAEHDGCNPARGFCYHLEFARYICHLEGMTVNEANRRIAEVHHEVDEQNEVLRTLLEMILNAQ